MYIKINNVTQKQLRWFVEALKQATLISPSINIKLVTVSVLYSYNNVPFFIHTENFCAPARIVWGIMHWWPSSVCPSVCLVPEPKSRTEGHRKLKIDREEAHGTGDPRPNLEVKMSTVKVTTPLNAVSEITEKPFEQEGLPTSHLVYRWSTMPVSSTWAVTSKLKTLGGCWSHHLQGGHIVAAHYIVIRVLLFLETLTFDLPY